MKISCKGYAGTLLSLEGTENSIRSMNGATIGKTVLYDVEMRAEDGAKISLSNVKESEILIELE